MTARQLWSGRRGVNIADVARAPSAAAEAKTVARLFGKIGLSLDRTQSWPLQGTNQLRTAIVRRRNVTIRTRVIERFGGNVVIVGIV